MALEIEAKMQIDDPAAMAKCLTDAGASPIGEFLEQNVFFDTPDGQLVNRDQGLRCRVATNLATGQSTCIITHKGKTLPGDLKTREETELHVADDAEQVTRLFNRLGFRVCLSFQKHRRSWKLDVYRIEIDTVPYLGHYLEIEGPSEHGVMGVREQLGLGALPLIRRGYASLLRRYTDTHNISPMDIRFPHPIGK